MKIQIYKILAVLFFFVLAPLASAHVVVKPAEVGVGSFQTFTMGVPVEHAVATVGMKLMIPDGLDYVSPNVKPGWKINIVKSGEGENAKVTAIEWSGGVIPAGQRDDFVFSAKVPASETKLEWKAYQTYADGSVVSWELGPDAEQPKDVNGESDYSKFGPASITKVINDLGTPEKSSSDAVPLTFSIVALALAVIALARTAKRQK